MDKDEKPEISTQELGKEYLDHVLETIRTAKNAEYRAKIQAYESYVKFIIIDAFLLGMVAAALFYLIFIDEDKT